MHLLFQIMYYKVGENIENLSNVRAVYSYTHKHSAFSGLFVAWIKTQYLIPERVSKNYHITLVMPLHFHNCPVILLQFQLVSCAIVLGTTFNSRRNYSSNIPVMQISRIALDSHYFDPVAYRPEKSHYHVNKEIYDITLLKHSTDGWLLESFKEILSMFLS